MTTTYFLNCIMGNVFGTQTSVALPDTYYCGLSSTEPASDGSGVTEPAGESYARVQLTSMSQPVDGVILNEEDIAFPETTEDWGTITHFVLYDSLSGGNLLMASALEKSRNIQSESQVRFKSGQMKITLDDTM